MDISIIIVSYNTAQYINKTIDSLLTQQDIDFEVIVIDNNSPDNSLDVLREYKDKITLIENPGNDGFGKANNLAVKQAKGKYILLFNPDAYFESDSALRDMYLFMEAHPNYGIAGAKVLNIDGSLQERPFMSYPGQRHTQADFSKLPGSIAWLLAPVMIISRKVYDEVGGFDEDYFLYGEDTQWFLDIRRQGYAVGYNDAVAVKHIGGGSEYNAKMYDYIKRKQASLHIFYRKNYSKADVIKLVSREKRRACYRKLMLTLKAKSLGLKLREKENLGKYSAIYDTSREFLAATK